MSICLVQWQYDLPTICPKSKLVQLLSNGGRLFAHIAAPTCFLRFCKRLCFVQLSWQWGVPPCTLGPHSLVHMLPHLETATFVATSENQHSLSAAEIRSYQGQRRPPQKQLTPLHCWAFSSLQHKQGSTKLRLKSLIPPSLPLGPSVNIPRKKRKTA